MASVRQSGERVILHADVLTTSCPAVARVLGIDAATAIGAWAQLLHWCLLTRVNTVSLQQLRAYYPWESAPETLEAFGLLVYLEDEACWRVSGVPTPAAAKAPASKRKPTKAKPKPNPLPRVPPEADADVPHPPGPLRLLTDDMVAAFEKHTGQKYAFNGAKDASAAIWMLNQEGGHEEVMRRWEYALQAEGWLQCNTVSQLRAKWNDLANAGPVEPDSIEVQPARRL